MIRAEPQGVGKELWRAIFFLHIAAYRGKSAGQGLLTTFTLGVYMCVYHDAQKPRLRGMSCNKTWTWALDPRGMLLEMVLFSWTTGLVAIWLLSLENLKWFSGDRSRASHHLQRSSLSQYGSERVHRNIADVFAMFCRWLAQNTYNFNQYTEFAAMYRPGNERMEAANGWNFSYSSTLWAGFLRRERQFYPTGSPLTMGNLDCKIRQRLWSIHHGYWNW